MRTISALLLFLFGCGLPAQTGAPAKQPGHVVVGVALTAATEDDGFRVAAEAAGAFHEAPVLAWDGTDTGALATMLREHRATTALFVLRPETLDIVLHRRLLLASARLDDDWFCDLSFGYLTAENGEQCQQLWQRIERRHRSGRVQGSWWQASVTSNKSSLHYPNSAPKTAAAAGLQGPHYYFSTKNEDRDAMIERALATLPEAQVAVFTGNSDPQGIWLFDGRRNLDRSLHWDYDPARVGEDEERVMPRLLAHRFRDLELDAPILWSGTCHSGAVHRCFVEGDIVSTFGRTERVTVHRLKPENSLALSWLHAGAASMLVPIGANHGMSVSMEVDFALRHGASLGETIKSTYDDVLLACRGDLELDLPVEGEAHGRDGYVMQGGGANRILIGDPLLRPFAAVESPVEKVTARRTDDGLQVTVTRERGWHPRSWDMYRRSGGEDSRSIVRIDLDELGLGATAKAEARVRASTAAGPELPCRVTACALEAHAGRHYLHLQANGTRADLDRKAVTFVFDVTLR